MEARFFVDLFAVFEAEKLVFGGCGGVGNLLIRRFGRRVCGRLLADFFGVCLGSSEKHQKNYA